MARMLVLLVVVTYTRAFLEHSPGFARLAFEVEVRADALFQLRRLADVQAATLGIDKAVDPRAIVESADLRF